MGLAVFTLCSQISLLSVSSANCLLTPKNTNVDSKQQAYQATIESKWVLLQGDSCDYYPTLLHWWSNTCPATFSSSTYLISITDQSLVCTIYADHDYFLTSHYNVSFRAYMLQACLLTTKLIPENHLMAWNIYSGFVHHGTKGGAHIDSSPDLPTSATRILQHTTFAHWARRHLDNLSGIY